MNHSNNEEFQPFIGQGVKDEHIDRALLGIFSPQESLIAIIKRITRAAFTSRYVIITNQRVILWNAGGTNLVYFTFDQITNAYSKGAFINGELVIVTYDGKTHNNLTRKGESEYVAQILQQQLENYYNSKQSHVNQKPARNNPTVNTENKSTKFCRDCGTKNTISNKFCTKCGKQM